MTNRLAVRRPRRAGTASWRAIGGVAALFIALLAALLPVAVQPAQALPLLPTTRVIVTADTLDVVLNAVSSVGGTVVTTLPVVDGVVADVNPLLVGVLDLLPGITVTPNVAVHMTATEPEHRAPAAVYPGASGATQLAAEGNDGGGVNVAVLDTGIDNLPDFAGRLVGGVDLSGGGNAFDDTFGHGTFVAGLIAGNGASSAGKYRGEAPGAGLVSVKVAGASGITDLATVLTGIQWTVTNRVQKQIRVLNLSLGVDLDMPAALNPLDRAVEAAWLSGIVVVVSAGNDGPFNGTILSPGDDPLVITVGALDDNGTVTRTDDAMSDFSSAGPTSPDGRFKPDLVASGRSVVSVRSPHSTIDDQYPTARIGSGSFVGSGTSFSSAITAGAAALVIDRHQSVWPDAVKARLLATAAPGPVGDPFVDGHGALDAYAAATTSDITLVQTAIASWPVAVGSSVLFANSWSASSWNSSRWSHAPWAGSAWNGSAWNGLDWNGSAWNGSAWNGSAWNGSAWNGSAWNGSAWNGSAWNGSAWNGSAWNGSAWNGSAWN